MSIRALHARRDWIKFPVHFPRSRCVSFYSRLKDFSEFDVPNRNRPVYFAVSPRSALINTSGSPNTPATFRAFELDLPQQLRARWNRDVHDVQHVERWTVESNPRWKSVRLLQKKLFFLHSRFPHTDQPTRFFAMDRYSDAAYFVN